MESKLKTTNNDDYELVYSDDPKKSKCKKCNKYECVCKAEPVVTDISKIKLKIQKETSGRAGKIVTEVKGLPENIQYLNDVLKKLKKLCGSGGTIKGPVLEIQGDHVDMLKKYFSEIGYKV